MRQTKDLFLMLPTALLVIAMLCSATASANAACVCAVDAPKAKSCLTGSTRVLKPNFSMFRYLATKYDAVNAYLTALASRATEHGTHKSQSERKFQTAACRMFLRWGFDRVEFLNNRSTSTQGVLAFHRKFTLLAFRGSELGRKWFTGPLTRPKLQRESLISMFKDWVTTDANMKQVPAGRRLGNRGKIHRGFKKAAESVLDSLIRSIQKSGRKQNPIFVTGHSLGGAVATLTALGLKIARLPVKALYAHAPPRVGDLAFRTSFLRSGIKSFRTINQRDPIPVFPPDIIVRRVIPTPYVDSFTQTLAFLAPNGRIRLNPNADLMKRERAPFLNPMDHDVATYVSRLRLGVPKKLRSRLPK
ncbi:MAG: lipase family protein [Bradymonadia bacterium]